MSKLLSGQQGRLSFAIAIAENPEILSLDKPNSFNILTVYFRETQKKN